TNQLIGPPFALAKDPQQIAMMPNGANAFVTDYELGQVNALDTATRQLAAPPVTGIPTAEWITSSPDGTKVFAGSFDSGTVTGISTATNQAFATVPTGKGVGALVYVPDQSPTAAFTVPKKIRPGVAAALNGSKSSDTDGTVARWAWAFQKGAGTA